MILVIASIMLIALVLMTYDGDHAGGPRDDGTTGFAALLCVNSVVRGDGATTCTEPVSMTPIGGVCGPGGLPRPRRDGDTRGTAR